MSNSKHIYVYSPSSAVRDRSAFKRGVAQLRGQGHEVEIDSAALARFTRFAGDDDARIAAIGRAAASGADVALITRGGYGITRILERINYKQIAKAAARGTQFVGNSDFTALQCAMLAGAGVESWAGPSLGEDFGAEGGPDEIMQACFDDMLCGQGEGVGWRLPRNAPTLPKLSSADDDWTITGATLWGGNLTMLCALIGTPWFPAIKGGVLFLEDVNEHPFHIERMLTQLLHSGVLGRQKAIVLGQFTGIRLAPHDRGYKLQTVIDRLRTLVKIPVLPGMPFGHVPTKVLLPVGRKVSLTVGATEAYLLWGHRH